MNTTPSLLELLEACKTPSKAKSAMKKVVDDIRKKKKTSSNG